MTHFEVDTALESLTVLIDTREQNTERLQKRLKQISKPYERGKLDFGDYSCRVLLPSGEWLDLRDKVVIERKMSLNELVSCYTTGRKRFAAEFERAKEAGAAIYLLIENANWEDVYAGKYRSKMTPKSLVASMLAWLARYDCQILMCSPDITGDLIRDILYREAKEILQHREEP